MSSVPENPEKSLPPPWDRIFSLSTRTFVWVLLLAVLYILSPFLLLIFLTFVFAYIQAHGVEGLAHRIKSRPIRVTIVGLVFLGTLFATGFTLVPQVKEQATTFLDNSDQYINDADTELDKFLSQWPSIKESLLRFSDEAENGEGSTDNESSNGNSGSQSGSQNGSQNGAKNGAKNRDEEVQTPTPEPDTNPPKAKKLQMVRFLLGTAKKNIEENTIGIGQSVLGYASAFLFALLFSFLIVLDLPKIKRGIAGLANTKIGFIYDEVHESIATFGRVLGRALEAQLFIAIVNTILTAVGVWMLGLPNLLVLSTIVFFCSFIPVAGTFISSTPICLLALQYGGVTVMMLAVLLICIIHAIETYVLNPQIYGHHMHMNPVVVLIVLTFGFKLFGVWGLLLGIPIVNYIWRHAIRRPEERPSEA